MIFTNYGISNKIQKNCFSIYSSKLVMKTFLGLELFITLVWVASGGWGASVKLNIIIMTGNFLSLLVQAVLVSSITYTSLKDGIMLRQGDELISTLGYIKLVLKSCTLNLYQFNLNSQNYQPTNQKYQGRSNVSCSYITIRNQNVVTENGSIFLALNSTDLVKVRLFIDDLANLRLIGERNDPFSGVISYYQQLKISSFSQTKPLIRILDSFQKISDNLQTPITNNKDWVFTVIQNQLIIRNKINEISRSFSLPSAFFSQIGIFDANNQTYPYTSFDGMRYSTVCQESKNELVGPFIIAVDGFWPVLRIYDQDGYILFEYTLNTNSQFYNPCPMGTFLFQDKCDLNCPASYTRQILNGRGSCRLSCEKGSYFDQINNMCVCKNRQISASQQYVCVNASSYQFGCFCQNNLFFDKSTRKCVQNCSKSSIAYKGLCLNCSPRCTTCSIQPGYPYLVVCTICQSGYILSNGVCVESNTNCTANCLTCLQGKCIACQPFYSLLNNTCIQQCSSNTKLNVYSNLTSVCDSQLDLQSCSPSCQVCSITNSSSCLVCKPGYYLILSLFMASCERKSLLFSCLSTNYVNFNNIVCYNNQTNSISTQNKCLSSISNCLLCVYQSNDKCVVCQTGFILQQNKCVQSCSQGFFQLNQACVPTITQCKINGFNNGQLYSNLLDLNIVTNNQFYNFLTSNGREQLNEPYGYQLFANKYYGIVNNYNPTNAVLFWSQAVCIQCNSGYGLSRDHKKCQPCPTGCLLCQYSYDGSCIATTISDVTLYTQGIDIKNCKTFLSTDFRCISSCPENTFPSMNPVYQQLMCGPYTSSQSQSRYLKIDGTTIQVSPSLYFHRLVFSAQLLNIPGIKNRLLQSGGSFDKNGTSFTIESEKPYFILNLSGEIQNYKSLGDTYPANSIYGININTSYSTYIEHSLAYIGYILSLLVLMTHCIYIGNGYTYKMDNLIIFAQTIFYFLFTDIFISNPVSQYYYGWSWMHVNFYPNYFWSLLSPDQKTIPPYALYNIDANFIRNAGGSISLFLTFGILWLLISGVCYYLQVKMNKWQVWYQRIFKNSLTSMIQFCTFNILYWAVAYFNYDFNSDSKNTKESYTGFPVMFIIGVISYTTIRFYLDIIGPFWKRTNNFSVSSLYMLKRIVYASVIACSYQHKTYLFILIAFELIFTLIRFYVIQRPNLLKQRLIMWVQTFAIILGTLILYVVKAAFAVAFLVTLVVYLWYLTFVIDLVDIYLISKNKVLKNSWLPCIQERIQEIEKQSSKDDFQQQQKTDRPLNQQVQK